MPWRARRGDPDERSRPGVRLWCALAVLAATGVTACGGAARTEVVAETSTATPSSSTLPPPEPAAASGSIDGDDPAGEATEIASSHPDRRIECGSPSTFRGDAAGPFDLPDLSRTNLDLTTRDILMSEQSLYGAGTIVVAAPTGQRCIEGVDGNDVVAGFHFHVVAMEVLDVLAGDLDPGEIIWVHRGMGEVHEDGHLSQVLHTPTTFLLFLQPLEYPSIGVVSEQWVSVGFIGGIYLDLRQSDAERFSRIDPAATALPAELTRDEVRAALARQIDPEASVAPPGPRGPAPEPGDPDPLPGR